VRYDAVRDCYVGDWLIVPAAVFEQALAARLRAGDAPDAAVADLRDELSWSLDVPGVRPDPRTPRPAAGQSPATPWPLRFRVAVVQPNATLATRLQDALERGGLRALTYVEATSDDAIRLRAFLTPAPSACIFGLRGPRARVWEKLQADAPDTLVVLTGPGQNPSRGRAGAQVVPYDGSAEAARAVAQAVRRQLLCGFRQTDTGAAGDPRARLLLRTHLLRALAEERAAQALAYRGWSLSLEKRSRRLVAQAATLRAQSQALQVQQAVLRAGQDATASPLVGVPVAKVYPIAGSPIT
jgi:hypothetical protein